MNGNLSEQINYELEKLVALETPMECWFSKVNTKYLQLCLSCVLLLKTRYPERDIRIVRVFDPTENTQEDWYHAAMDNLFPICLPDKNVFCSPWPANEAMRPLNFIQKMARVSLWMVKQCNYVCIYQYPMLLNSTNHRLIHCAYHQKDTTVIPLGLSDTEAFLAYRLACMSDPTYKNIVEMLSNGSTQKEIGATLRLSISQMGRICDAAERELHQALQQRRHMAEAAEASRASSRRACLLGLHTHTAALPIVVFEGLVRFLTSAYRINEFWIDEETGNSVYGAVLSMCCYKRYDMDAQITVCIAHEDNDLESQNRAIAQYCPPYHGVSYVVTEDGTWESACQEIIEGSSFCLADSRSDGYALIRNACAKSGHIRLIDLFGKYMEADASVRHI